MKKILTTTLFFAFLGLLVFSFATCKHSSGSGDDDFYSGLGSGSGKVRTALTKPEVEELLKGTSSSPVRYKQSNWGIYDESGNFLGNDGWGEFSFYYQDGLYYYEFDNWAENSDQEKGSVEINSDASVTVTAEYWHVTENDDGGDTGDAGEDDDWTETTPSTSSPKHKIHKYCGFILQFYDDGSAEVYEWLVKENYESDIPTTFPAKEIGTDEYGPIYNSDTQQVEWDYTADVVYDFLTEDDDYWKQ